MVCKTLPGIRLINQDPWECLISFIFSSNNNIKRITKGLDLLRSQHGVYSCSVQKDITHRNGEDVTLWRVCRIQQDSEVLSSASSVKQTTIVKPETVDHNSGVMDNESTIHLYTFPSVEALSTVSEQTFREMG